MDHLIALPTKFSNVVPSTVPRIIHDPKKAQCASCRTMIQENQVLLVCMNCPLIQGVPLIYCNKCVSAFSNHHNKKGHCFATLLNRAFYYDVLNQVAKLDEKKKSISKNGVLVLDQYCSQHDYSNLFTMPKSELEQHSMIQYLEGKTVHKSITCDGCEMSIHGTRYRCMNCDNFDLCSSCMRSHTKGIQKVLNPATNIQQQQSGQYMKESVYDMQKSTNKDEPFQIKHNPNHVFIQTCLPITNNPGTLPRSIYSKEILEELPTNQNTLTTSTSIWQKNESVFIQAYSIDIFESLYEIECLCFSKPMERSFIYKSLLKSLHNNVERPVDNFVWVALVDSGFNNGSFFIAGYIMYSINKEKQKAEITSFAVHPSLRSRGIGQELARFSIQHIQNYEWWYQSIPSSDHHVVTIDQLTESEDLETRYYVNKKEEKSFTNKLLWKCKCKWVQLHVSTLNLPAQKLYTKFGFKASGYCENYYSHDNGELTSSDRSDCGDGVIMVLELNSQ